jgi:hypothetical protein
MWGFGIYKRKTQKWGRESIENSKNKTIWSSKLLWHVIGKKKKSISAKVQTQTIYLPKPGFQKVKYSLSFLWSQTLKLLNMLQNLDFKIFEMIFFSFFTISYNLPKFWRKFLFVFYLLIWAKHWIFRIIIDSRANMFEHFTKSIYFDRMLFEKLYRFFFLIPQCRWIFKNHMLGKFYNCSLRGKKKNLWSSILFFVLCQKFPLGDNERSLNFPINQQNLQKERGCTLCKSMLGTTYSN